MSDKDKDEAKISDLRNTDIDAENLTKIEAMGVLLKSAPKDSAQRNWGFAQAQAVVAILEEKEIEPGLLQKGQAQCCSYRIPIRYWLVEVSVGLVFAYIAYLYSQDLDLITLIARLVFSWIMIAVMVIDFETMMIKLIMRG